MLNTSIAGTSVIRHRSSRHSIKETTVTGKVADNQIKKLHNSILIYTL